MIENIRRYFDKCGYAEDFEAVISLRDVLDDFDESGYTLWLKAYDTSCCETDKERYLFEQGYWFDCYMWVVDDDGNMFDAELNMYARTEDDAVKLFNNIVSDKRKLREFVRECMERQC